MSHPTAGRGLAGEGRVAGPPLRRTLEAWRQWLHLEAIRARPYGRHDDALARLARQHRERCEVAAKELLCGEPGRADPVEMRRLQELLRELEGRAGALRCHLAGGEVVTDAPLCGLLATQLSASLMLLWLLVGRDEGAAPQE
jgi:hypothetical protein